MMRPILAACLAMGWLMMSSGQAADLPAGADGFTGRVLVTGLAGPWEMVFGPDGWLWVTERQGPRVTRIDPATGERQVVATIDRVHAGLQQEGLLGMALAPGLLDPASRADVYLAYTYDDASGEHARIGVFDYDPATHRLGDGRTVLDGLPASNDHNGGRLRLG